MRLIDADELKEFLDKKYSFGIDLKFMLFDEIDNQPTVYVKTFNASDLLDKAAEKFIAWDSKVKGTREDGVCFFTIENILKGIEEMKAEVENAQGNI